MEQRDIGVAMTPLPEHLRQVHDELTAMSHGLAAQEEANPHRRFEIGNLSGDYAKLLAALESGDPVPAFRDVAATTTHEDLARYVTRTLPQLPGPTRP